MKLFTCKQIAEIDKLTMKMEPISSLDLMERASGQVAEWITRHVEPDHEIYIFSGPGNNGGDALAVARLLAWCNYRCTVWLADFGKEMKEDLAFNLKRLEDQNKVILKRIDSAESIPQIPSGTVIIEGLFGSGLNKPLSGLAKAVVEKINQSGATVISIDMPGGLFGEDNSDNDFSAIVRATHTLTFQFPKLSFLFPENDLFVGTWKVLPIGLHPEAIHQTQSTYFNLVQTYISGYLKKRAKFSHKGTYGHSLLIAGSYGKMGAAVLASKACLRAGAGLLTSHVPASGYQIIQNSVPEAMASTDPSATNFSKLPELNPFSAIGIGPGLDKKPETKQAFFDLIQEKPGKLVIDADALNILSENPEWYSLLQENTILTPHPKEFERLAGPSVNSYERLQKQIQFSVKHKIIVVFKGAHSCITVPNGSVFFNSTGNPGMATAGSGDVLTGIILGLLAQAYSPEEAVLIAVYIHGLAGDLAAAKFGYHSMIAGDIIEQLGSAFVQLE